MITHYTVYELSTGKVVRSGGAEPANIPKPTSTHGVVVGLRTNPNTDRIELSTAAPVARTKTVREEWRESLPAPELNERDVMLEALKARLTPAELQAARARLKAK